MVSAKKELHMQPNVMPCVKKGRALQQLCMVFYSFCHFPAGSERQYHEIPGNYSSNRDGWKCSKQEDLTGHRWDKTSVQLQHCLKCTNTIPYQKSYYKKMYLCIVIFPLQVIAHDYFIEISQFFYLIHTSKCRFEKELCLVAHNPQFHL